MRLSRTKDEQPDGPRVGLTEIVISQIRTLGSRFHDLGDTLESLHEGRPPAVEVLQYSQVVKFLVENQDAAPGAVAGALAREAQGDRYRTHLFFLDEEGTPIAGGKPAAPARAYDVGRFDDELTALFAGKDVIVFK